MGSDASSAPQPSPLGLTGWPRIAECRCSIIDALGYWAAGASRAVTALIAQSHLSCVIKHEIGAAGCEVRQIPRCGLALRAAERGLDRSHAVESQHRDQINARGTRGRCHGALTDLEFPQARHFLRQRNMGLGIV